MSNNGIPVNSSKRHASEEPTVLLMQEKDAFGNTRTLALHEIEHEDIELPSLLDDRKEAAETGCEECGYDPCECESFQ